MRMLTALLLPVALLGCSAASVYQGTTEWRTRECSHLLEPERSACERAARNPLPDTAERDR